jgi:hypothetical protein
MDFKEAIEIMNNHTTTFGERVNANSFLQTLDYEKKEIGTINGEKVIKYSYKNETYYYYKNGFKTKGFFIGLINKLFKYSEILEVSVDVFNEFGIVLEVE